MKLVGHIKGTRRQPLVTVCWLDGEVSFAMWKAEENGLRCSRVARRGGEACDPETYLEALQELTGGKRLRSLHVCWLVFQEAWPEMPSGESGQRGLELALPGWIRRCWEGLDPVTFPDEVVSGLTTLEEGLLKQGVYATPGTGLLMRAGSRLLLLARGETGRLFRRVSRRDLVHGTGAGVCREWLLQSRTLFRNRTGLELKRVFVVEESGLHLPEVADFPVRVEPAGSISFPGVDNQAFPASACRILHGSCASGSGLAANRLELAALSQRQRWHKWERRLRTSTCVLLACWGLMFIGACRHEAILPEIGEADIREWKQYERDLTSRQQRWQRSWTSQQAQARPFRLIARVVADRPEGVAVTRVRVGQGSGKRDKEVSVRLEGTYSGEATNPAFRRWLGELRQSSPVDKVRNLQFTRSADGIIFSLDGSAHLQAGGGQ